MSGRGGFTLIELSVSVAVGAALLAATASAMLYLRALIARNAAILGLHREAAAVQRTLADALQMAQASTQWRLQADPGAGGWDDGDERVALTWMTAVADPAQRTYTFGKDWEHDLVWARLEWRAAAPASGRVPSLHLALSDGFREATVAVPGGSRAIRAYPQPRRDRRRDLDDNDLRFVPGIDPATWAAIGLPGDGADLALQMQPLCGPTTRVEGLRLGWYDRRGHWVGVAAGGSGIVELDAGGAAVPLLGRPWSRPEAVALDGVRLDGGSDSDLLPGEDPVPAWRRRPVLVQISFTLVDDPAPADAAQREHAPGRAFAFSFPVDPVEGGF